MANPYYNYDSAFIPGQLARAESVAAEFTAVQVGFALLSYDGTDSGTANNYIVATGGAPTGSYSNGQLVRFQAKTTGTGPGTINVNAIGTVALTRFDGSPLQSGDVTAGVFYTAQYDATGGKFRITSPAAYTTSAGTVSGSAPTHLVGLTAAGGVSTAVAPIDVTFAIDQGISPTWTGSHTFSTVPTFSAGTVPVNRGGTGLATYAVGDLVYANGTASLARLADVATGSFLQSGGVGVAPAWGALPGLFSGFASPSASIGIAAVNGTATTAMRADAAPALSQAISPTWSGTHTFSNAITVNGAGSSLKGGVSVTAPAAGTALSVTAVSGAAALQSAGVGSSLNAIFNGGNVTTGNLESSDTSRTNKYTFGRDNASSGNWVLAFNGTELQHVTSAGNFVVNAPSSGRAVVVNGLSGTDAILVNGGASAGSSFGLNILSGTNASDYSLQAVNQAGTVTYFKVRGDGVVFGNDGTSLFELGYKSTPLNVQTVNYAAVAADRGKTIQANGSTGQVITIPANVFSGGDVVTVLCTAGTLGSGTASIAQGAGLTMTWAIGSNTAGSRTLASPGLATIVFASATSCFITGSGLS